MVKNVFVYISGPMTPKHGFTIEENIAAGARVYWDLLQRGIPAFCPHLSGAFPTAWSVLPHADWLAYDFAVIDRCTHVLMMPRWETSTGAVEERAYAETRGLPVFFSTHELAQSVAAVDPSRGEQERPTARVS
jgi:hypothetical protein